MELSERQKDLSKKVERNTKSYLELYKKYHGLLEKISVSESEQLREMMMRYRNAVDSAYKELWQLIQSKV
jgi:hypothetical protein